MGCRFQAIRVIALGAIFFAGVGCEAAKEKLKEAAGTMEFSGTVLRAGTAEPITGATVALIPLATEDAIKALVEVRKVPDGSGGEKDRLLVKLDAVQAYVDTSGDVVKTTTDAAGKFKTSAPTNIYLVYSYGPGGNPGSTASAYGPHFWGINPETGELGLDHLIGKDLKLQQVNDQIQLGGGPVPPAPTAAATELPTQDVTPPAGPATLDDVQPEPKADDPALPPGNIMPPVASAFWKSIKLDYKDGSIGTGTALETKTAPLADGQRYLTLTAELATAQAEPVVLVLQKGFDSTYVADCADTVSAATVRVYPVGVNGSVVTYQLVPPGPFYKMFLAKAATLGEEGEAPTAVEDASETLTVGERTCANAVPERPFLATLSWDKEGDIDLHVTKYDAAKVKAATTAEMIGEAIVDSANYTRRQGTTMTLDVDNVHGYGPENNGDDKGATDSETSCYLVQVHYYSGYADSAVTASIDVTLVSTKDGKKLVKQMPNTVTLTTTKEWKTIGAFGPTECAKLLNPPSTPENVIEYPASASSCTISESCALKGNEPGKYKATVTLEKSSFAANEAVKVQYSKMPGEGGDWITIVPKGQTDASWCTWQWSTGTEGTQWYGGMPPGDYEVRMYYGWSGGQCEVIGRQGFTVTP